MEVNLMTKLELIQRKIKELKLYREYLLRIKLFNSLNGVYNKGMQKK